MERQNLKKLMKCVAVFPICILLFIIGSVLKGNDIKNSIVIGFVVGLFFAILIFIIMLKLDKTNTKIYSKNISTFKFLEKIATFLGVLSAFGILFMLVIRFISPTKVPFNSFLFFSIVFFLCIGYLLFIHYSKKN